MNMFPKITAFIFCIILSSGSFAQNLIAPGYKDANGKPEQSIGVIVLDSNGNSASGVSTNNASASTGGISSFTRIISSSASTNATLVKSSAGRLYKFLACNTTTAVKYVHFTNTATIPVPGTTPVFQSRPLAASATAGVPACSSFEMMDLGVSYSAGIGFWLSTGGADTDAVAIAAGDIVQLEVAFQ